MKLFYLICLWWFDDLHCRVPSGNAAMESLPEHRGKDFRVPFYFSEHCIPFPGPVKWILSDQWGFCLLHPISLRPTRLEVLRWPKTDLRAASPNNNAEDAWLWLLMSWTFILSILTSQYPSMIHSYIHIHMEGPYRYRIHTMCTKLLQLHDSKGIDYLS